MIFFFFFDFEFVSGDFLYSYCCVGDLKVANWTVSCMSLLTRLELYSVSIYSNYPIRPKWAALQDGFCLLKRNWKLKNWKIEKLKRKKIGQKKEERQGNEIKKKKKEWWEEKLKKKKKVLKTAKNLESLVLHDILPVLPNDEKETVTNPIHLSSFYKLKFLWCSSGL